MRTRHAHRSALLGTADNAMAAIEVQQQCGEHPLLSGITAFVHTCPGWCLLSIILRSQRIRRYCVFMTQTSTTKNIIDGGGAGGGRILGGGAGGGRGGGAGGGR